MLKSMIFRGAQALLVALLVALLAACGGRDAINKGTSDIPVANAPTTFDLTVAADKDGQFEYEGATLTREDLAGHIRYLDETGKPVHSLLLTTGEKQKITNTHVAALAGICRDLKMTGYVRDNDGHLKVIQIVE
ncbi:MAG: hypothetical protein JSS28_02850 [Proteobacteria bacterium]|nr:hypothetical protein [Pseudomonadota bacterium]